jgi:hypothetical protein
LANRVHEYLPPDEIMQSASLIVGHGGHSSTMRGLAHELPLRILPMHRIFDQLISGKLLVLAEDRFSRRDTQRRAISSARPVIPVHRGNGR